MSRFSRVFNGIFSPRKADIVPSLVTRPEFSHLPRSGFGLQYLIDNYRFSTVLDVGSGEGAHALVLEGVGKKVTRLDLGKSAYFDKDTDSDNVIVADLMTYQPSRVWDCVWASHVLEHQVDANRCIKKLGSLVAEGGILAVTVPPFKNNIVGGHVSAWNQGMLLYQFIMAGLDCRHAEFFKYGYNITLIIRKKEIELPENMSFDIGDIEMLSEFFPAGFYHGIDGSRINRRFYGPEPKVMGF
ncbi:class I SAM-dependent methyltransferase [Mesorhizobium sp. ANAO-SY3R2]|uniref:class I SAM-dependent methyltransferase n=1 Tax=Mesorhizobium sp. ANAO-SY3R2 TaxID=3166644 RepID=UPI00366CF377